MTKPTTLPRDLGDGLLLRWARSEDMEAIAQFNVDYLSDDPADLNLTNRVLRVMLVDEY